MSGTSNSSPHSWMPPNASDEMLAPVADDHNREDGHIVRIDQVRMP